MFSMGPKWILKHKSWCTYKYKLERKIRNGSRIACKKELNKVRKARMCEVRLDIQMIVLTGRPMGGWTGDQKAHFLGFLIRVGKSVWRGSFRDEKAGKYLDLTLWHTNDCAHCSLDGGRTRDKGAPFRWFFLEKLGKRYFEWDLLATKKGSHLDIQMGKNLVSDGHFCTSFCPAQPKISISGDLKNCYHVLTYPD